MFSSHASLSYLAGLCGRVAAEMATGVDPKNTWKRELVHSKGPARAAIQQIGLAVAQGQSITEAVRRNDHFFPPTFVNLVEVGEETGNLAEVFYQLSGNYEQQLQMRREFLRSLIWPIFQLVFVVILLGIVIYALGVIQGMTSTTTDILGFGLIGTSGLTIYISLVLGAIAAGVIFWQLVKRGALRIAPIQLAAMKLPGLSGVLQTLSLSKFAWTLQMCLMAGLEIRKSSALALQSTHNYYYTRLTESINRGLTQGRPLNEILYETKAFPWDFCDMVAVGENTGRMDETLEVLSQRYQVKASQAVQWMSRIGSVTIGILIAVVIIFLIFRIFGTYINALNDAVNSI